MNKIDKNFVLNNEILFLGVSKQYKMFSDMAYDGFVKKNVKVFPVRMDNEKYKYETFGSINEISSVPKTAYTIMDTSDNKKIMKDLKAKGVTKILFHSKNIIDDELLTQCKELGFEVAVSCPLMYYGSGLHRFHGFISGVKK